MASKEIYWLIWCLFILYSVFLAPNMNKESKSTSVYVKQLMFGPWNDIDPYVLSLFYFLGIWPLVYMSILLIDGQHQSFNGSLAASLAMALGGFVLLPYFALRRSEKSRKFQINTFVRLFESKLITIILMISTVGLILFALTYRNFRIFLHEFSHHRFIHIMTIDFFVVSFLFPFLIDDDLKRREITQNNSLNYYFSLCFIPLLGPLIYLYQRPSLDQTNKKASDN